jgi:hypothetical protein
MPKARENLLDGENTPRDDKEKKGEAPSSGVDAGGAPSAPQDDIMFKEGDSVICSAKKMKAQFDGQTATIIKLMPKNKVNIMMTSGPKKDECRVVDAKTVRPNETLEETRARHEANARALFGETK